MKRIKEIDGGCLKGYFKIAPSRLVEKFGEPEEVDEYKVSGQITLKTRSGIKFYLYDWKCTSLYDYDYQSPQQLWSSNKEFNFHIGGNFDSSKLIEVESELSEVFNERN